MANFQSGARWTVVAAATSLLALAGCGSGGAVSATSRGTPTPIHAATSSPSGATGKGPQPVQIQYLTHIIEGSDGTGWQRTNIVTDGHTKARYSWTLYDTPNGPPGEQELYVWDGNRLMEHSGFNEPGKGAAKNDEPYTVYEAPKEWPDLPDMASFVNSVWPTLQTGCTDLKTTKTIIGRVTNGYRCTEATPDPEGPTAHEMWIDQATGIQLADCYIPCGKYLDSTAEKLVLNPKTDAMTFSTHPPRGAKVSIIAARNAPKGQKKKAPDFTLDLVKGGRIGLKDLAGQPFVLTFFSSDLAGGDEACPGCRQALLTLQTLTRNGTKPRVLAVQEGDDMSMEKLGHRLVVPGLTLTLAQEKTGTVAGAFGLASYVFVSSDGTIAASYLRTPTKLQITQGLAALQ